MKQLVTLHTMMFKWIIMSIQFCMCDALLSVQYRERWSHTPSTSRVFQSEIVLNLCNDFHEVEMYTLWALEPWTVFGERFYLYSRKFVEIHYLNSFNTFEFGLHVSVMSWNFWHLLHDLHTFRNLLHWGQITYVFFFCHSFGNCA